MTSTTRAGKAILAMLVLAGASGTFVAPPSIAADDQTAHNTSSAEEKKDAAIEMIDQHIDRFPNPWLMRKSDGEYKWSYTHGLVLLGIEQFYRQTGDRRYLDYIRKYADHFISEDGEIETFSVTEFNIDSVNAGKMLFLLYDETGDEHYRRAMDQLRTQLEYHPRTQSGGFWHKRKYPWQIWLDGLYMAQPFYAEYEKRFGNDPAAFDDIVSQLVKIEQVTRNPETGLLYHGWDESRLQAWADPETGLSPGYWSRAMGWYAMAIVDTYPHIPQDHPGRAELAGILSRLVEALEEVQHPSGLWYQVPDQGNREGNWLEASGSSMFAYAIAKGVRLDMLPEEKLAVAEHAYRGIEDRLVYRDDAGNWHLKDVCRSAGLGGTPYRDGSYEYYISTDRVEDDAHGLGSFFLAASEANFSAGE